MVPSTRNQDLLALDIYRRTESTGEPVTLAMVQQRIRELRGHDAACGCGLCTAAERVGAEAVFRIARAWASVGVTRRCPGAVKHRDLSGPQSMVQP